MTTENRINKTLESFNFFKIEVTADLKIEDKIYKNVKQFNNDSIITSKNWEQNKNTFFAQRMQTCNETFTLAEKINLEIENLEALTTNENEYRILKNRYKSFLLDKQITPQQTEAVNPDEVLLKNEYIKIFKNDLGFTLFTKMYELYKTEKTDLANFSFLYFAMVKDFLVCNQADFVKFLEIERYDVSIGKIDSRHWNLDMNIFKKSNLYNSIKGTLQKKHGISTI